MSSRLIIDVRDPVEFNFGKLKGVISYPYGKILEDKEAFCLFCADKTEIILCCRSGRRSRFARSILSNCGIVDVDIKTPSLVRKMLNDE
tara:strand:+ start:469 stop:735 length:267 start_codon:yes stop_codon:yes gene_type:complete